MPAKNSIFGSRCDNSRLKKPCTTARQTPAIFDRVVWRARSATFVATRSTQAATPCALAIHSLDLRATTCQSD